MNTAAILALLGDLYAQIAERDQRIAALEAEKQHLQATVDDLIADATKRDESFPVDL